MLLSLFDWLTLKSVILGIFVGFLCRWLIRRLKYKLPPGPMALPLIGNLDLLKPMIHTKLGDWSKKYGPVITIYFGPYPTIVLNGLDVVLEALVKKGNEFADRPHIPSADAFTAGGSDIAFGRFGPRWRLHRKIASSAMRQYMMGDGLQIRIHDSFCKVSQLLKEKKGTLDPKKYLELLVFNILYGFCYAESLDIDDPEFKWIIEAVENINTTLGSGVIEDIVPFLEYFPTKKFRNMKKVMEEMHQRIGYRMFKKHKETFDPSNIRDFTDCLLLAREEAEKDDDENIFHDLTETHLVFTLFDIFMAGLDTSRITLHWIILYMAAFPEIQSKVQEEIDRIVGRDRLPGLMDRSKLVYTESVIRETMRLKPAVPIGVPHMTTCDTSLAGFDIPKGWNVLINHWALLNDENAWTDVDRFMPERYLDANGQLRPKPPNWLPFSAGRRICLGESIARPQLHLIVACLMQQFKFRLPPGVIADLEGTGSSFAFVAKPYQVTIESRI